MEVVARKIKTSGLRLMLDDARPEFVMNADGLRCSEKELHLRDENPNLVLVGREEGMSAICYCSLVASSISLKSSE